MRKLFVSTSIFTQQKFCFDHILFQFLLQKRQHLSRCEAAETLGMLSAYCESLAVENAKSTVYE